MSIYEKLQQIDRWLTTEVVVKDEPFAGAVFDGVGNIDNTSFIYHEITGYQLSYYNQLLKALPNSTTVIKDEVRDLQDQTYNYLLERGQKGTLIPHGYSINDNKPSDTEYLFDNGMILQGLCDTAGDADMSGPIEKLANAICRSQFEDGSFPAARSAKDNSASFSADRGCLHIKLAIGLLKAETITNSGTFGDAAIRVLEWGRSLQKPDGSYRANERSTAVTTHAFCYALEGYLYAYHRLDEVQYLSIVEDGINWLVSHSDSRGRLTRGGNVDHRGAFGFSERLQSVLQWRYWDETIQAGRLLHILYKLTGNDNYKIQRDRIVATLINLPGDSIINCVGRFQKNPLNKTFTWPNQFASQLLRFVLDDNSAADSIEVLF